ncbi:MAG: hypothetical protein ACRD04_07885 [Terriglobales bacterium]
MPHLLAHGGGVPGRLGQLGPCRQQQNQLDGGLGETVDDLLTV